jgi:outer membrane protein TolC
MSSRSTSPVTLGVLVVGLAAWSASADASTDNSANVGANVGANIGANVSTSSSSSSSSTATTPLTLDEVIESAVTLHPTMLAAIADVDFGEADVLNAEGAFDPVARAFADGGAGNYVSGGGAAGLSALTPFGGARVDGGWRLGVGDYPTYAGKDKTNDLGELSLGISLPLLRGFTIDGARATVERRGVDVERRRARRDLSELDLARAAAADYFDWVAAGARLDVATFLLTLAERRDSQLKRRADLGDVAAIDVADNARLIAQRQSRMVFARRAFERASLKLSLSLRDEDGRPMVPTAARLPRRSQWSAETVDAVVLKPEDADAMVEAALSSRPELEALRQALRQNQIDARLADNTLLPNLSVSAKVSQDVGDTHDPLSSSSSVWNPDPKTRALPDAGVMLAFDMPVLLRSARGQVGMVDATKRQLMATMALARDHIALEVNDAVQAKSAAVERAAFAATEAAAAKDVLAGESSSYEAGDSTLLIVNLREVAVAEAELSAIDARVDVDRATAALRFVQGVAKPSS